MPESSKHELDAPPWLRVESTLMSAARGIRRAYDRRLEELELNLSEAILLAFLQESVTEPLTQVDLARHLGVGRAATGSLIDSLERQGLIERRPNSNDRRVWLIGITTAGREIAKQIAKIDEQLRAELRDGISRKERRELNRLLNRLRENVSRVIEAPST